MLKFTRNRRLQTPKDFRYVFQKAKKIGGVRFTLLVREKESSLPRIGIIVAKRFVKKAVLRNRIKRVVRESFRVQTSLPSVDIVFLARSGLAETSPHDLSLQLVKMWNKLKSL